MSSVGQALGGIVGGGIGFFLGNPLYGAQIGIMLGGLIDPPKGPSGPRLEDLSVQTSTYGAFIPRLYGTVTVNGNVFWLLNDRLTEVKTTEGGKGGPEVTTFSYYATFAVGLCKGPIDGIRRIWIGADLWYDAGSDDLGTVIASNEQENSFTVYLGTDTQEADPLIAADKGVANVPAYRGLAYIVFDTLPLAKYSNSLIGAQVKVEVVASGAARTLEIIDTRYFPPSPPLHAPTYVRPLRPNLGDKPVFRAIGSVGAPYPVYELSLFSDSIREVEGYTGSLTGWSGFCDGEFDATCILDSNTKDTVRVISKRHGEVVSDEEYPTGLAFTAGTYAAGFVIDTSKTLWYSTKRNSSAEARVVAIRKYPWDSDILLTLELTTRSYEMTYDVARDQVVILYAGRIEKYDAATAVLDETVTLPSTITDVNYGVSTSISVDGDYLWTYKPNSTTRDLHGYDLDTGVLVHDFQWTALGGPSVRSFVIGNLLVALDDTGTGVDNRYLYLYRLPFGVTGGTVPLGDIVEAECLQSRLLAAGDLDVTDLTDEVRGYRVSALGPIRGGLDPLRAAWPFDVVQHGYDIKFVRCGGASVATIPAADLGAVPGGQATGVQIEDTREMDLVLPRKMRIKYLDATREYDINEQFAERSNTDAVNETTLDLPIVFIADEAAGKAETLLYVAWLERSELRFSLPPSYRHLEPGDVVTVQAEHATYELRLTAIEYLADGRLACMARPANASVYTPTAVGEEGQGTGSTLGLGGPTELALLDIPLLVDDQDTAGFVVALGAQTSGWPGGLLYRSTDTGQTWMDLVAQSAPGPTIGYAEDSIGSHGGTVYDFSSRITVRLLGSATLASVTETQLFAGQNWFAYGAHGRWEIIAARSVLDNGDGSYTLYDLLRGQRGTEWATGEHETGDRLVLLDLDDLGFVSVNSSTIGSEFLYRGVTSGKTLSSADDEAFTYTGVNLECLSPVHLTGHRHPTTRDWTLTWTRRSRYADWRDYVDAPLGEASESYELDLYEDGTYATVVRTLSATSSTVGYTAARQIADFPGSATETALTTTNPGAESGSATGWTSTTGALTATTTQGGVTPHSGSYFFYGGANAETIAYQDIDVSAWATLIDDGAASLRVSWWGAGFTDSDTAGMDIEFLDGGSASISSSAGTQYDGTSTWVQRERQVTIPVDTRTVRLSVHMVRAGGTNNDGYVDDIEAYIAESNVGTLYGKLYQLSASVGRGYPLTFSITRS